MKKIICFCLAFMLLMLSACGENEYPAVASTEKESRVLFTLKVGDAEYDVKYELYRAFFLTYKSEVDGGDSSVWTSDNSEDYVKAINSLIIPKIADIYSTIYVCEKTGFDLYSSEVEEKINEYITESIEGGESDGMIIEGYGTYDNFLAELKKMNLNYSVQLLLYRYAIAQDAINEYYAGTLNEDNITEDAREGALKFTRDDVKAFYESEECVRVLRAFVQERLGEALAENIRHKMFNAVGEEAVAVAIIGSTLTAAEDVINGVVIGRHSLDTAYYSEMTEAAFNLSEGEVSEVIHIRTGYENGYFIMYGAKKSDSHFEECYNNIVEVYIDNEIGKLLHEARNDMLADIEYKDAYNDLVFSQISMDE